ncbi:hypothetical protein BD779DRAFT_1674996 [Infundibulicybe gibba]|nr:hypothetical protein BD779DRAFT_1674996 [Infundibulicybe gibba]
MPGSPYAETTILALSLESLLYGLFLSLFAASTFFLPRAQQRALQSRPVRPHSTPTFYLSIAMLVLVTTHWALSIAISLEMMVFLRNRSASDIVYAGSSSMLAKTCILVVLLMVGDISIIYRLWVVWGHHKYVTIPPILLFIGHAISTVVILSKAASLPGRIAQDQAMGKLLAAPYAMAMCTSFYCTALVSWKVWKVERAVGGAANSGRQWLKVSSMPIMPSVILPSDGAPDGRPQSFRAATIESAVLYSCWFTFFLATFLATSPLAPVASDTMAQITGIAFIAINVRVGLQKLSTPSNDKA